MAKNFFLFMLISLTACGNPKKQGQLADSPTAPLIFTKHKSLEKFLDSLTQTPGITYSQAEPRCSADTFALALITVTRINLDTPQESFTQGFLRHCWSSLF